jgi:hypothetical protein
MTRLFEYIVAQDDPFEFVYEGISGTHGVETQTVLTELYNDICIDQYLHPDDDFEKIIDRMINYMEHA